MYGNKIGSNNIKLSLARNQPEMIAAELRAKLLLSEVLMVTNGENVVIGSPVVAGNKVEATVIAQRSS